MMEYSLESFFRAIFDPKDLGYIEIRAIASLWVQTDQRVKRVFCESIEDAIEAVKRYAESHIPYNIYYGVLPRVSKGGSKEYTPSGKLIWLDIDLKDVGTYENAYKMLLKAIRICDKQPLSVVDSGHGLHCYWSTNGSYSGDSLTNYMANLQPQCGADSTNDATRVLRVPGTYNRKYPTEHKLCNIVFLRGPYEPREDIYIPPSIDSTQNTNKAPSRGTQMPYNGLISEPYNREKIDWLTSEYVTRGIVADKHKIYVKRDNITPDHSRMHFSMMLRLARSGFTEGQIYSVFTDPSLAIANEAMEKGEGYIVRSIRKALDA